MWNTPVLRLSLLKNELVQQKYLKYHKLFFLTYNSWLSFFLTHNSWLSFFWQITVDCLFFWHITVECLFSISGTFGFLFQKLYSESVKVALHSLMTSAKRLQEECAECSDITSETEELTFDPSIKTQQVIQCAYDIAKSAKQLVTLFQCS